jgi:hypothetical protein
MAADGSLRPRSVSFARGASLAPIVARLRALAAAPDEAMTELFGGGCDFAPPPPAAARSPGGSCAAAGTATGSQGFARGAGGPAATPTSRLRAAAEEGGAGGDGGGDDAASPSGGLRPRVLRLDEEPEGGGADAPRARVRTPSSVAAPPPSRPAATAAPAAQATPSRRRPPGLPLAPPSPSVSRRSAGVAPGPSGAPPAPQPPTPSSSRRAAPPPSGPVVAPTADPDAPVDGSAAPAPPPWPPLPPPGDLLGKLLRRPGLTGTPGKAARPGTAMGDGGDCADGAVAVKGEEEESRPAGGTPARTSGRTPGRTAVQEAMLQCSAARRSAAKRSRLVAMGEEAEEGGLDQEHGGGRSAAKLARLEVDRAASGEAEEGPRPVRLAALFD